MKKLTIVTDYWRIVEAENFFYIQMILDDSEEEPKFHLIGVLDDDGSSMLLATRETAEDIVHCFTILYLALDAQRPLVDFRRPNVDAINILKNNTNQKPGSEWN